MTQPQNTPQETGDKIALAAILAVLLFPVALLLGFFQLVRRPLTALWNLILHGPPSEGEAAQNIEEPSESSECGPTHPQVQYSDPPFGGRRS